MYSYENETTKNFATQNLTDHRIARHLRRTHPLRETIRFYSIKNGCILWLESFLELTACLLREFDPSITAYATQPKRFRYPVGGKSFLYTPDAAVLFCDNSQQFEEVKPWSSFKSKSVSQGFKRLQVVFEHDVGIPLVHNPALDGSNCKTALNLELLYRYLGLERKTENILLALDLAPNKTSVGNLIEVILAHQLPAYLAYQTIALGHYKYSPQDSLLDLQTQLQRSDSC